MSDVLAALIAENRHVRAELRAAEERLRAFERSRWSRLNPRRLLGSRRRRPEVAAVRAARVPVVTTEKPGSELDRFRREVVAGGSFTDDWLTNRLESWQPILGSLEGRACRILEVGSYEGLSACYLLWRLPDATITCIDTFERRPDLEATFDANLTRIDPTRATKLVGDSRRLLHELLVEGKRFEFAYIDGSHHGLDVLVDAALSWQLLEPGGVVVFDDYLYTDEGEDALLRPGPAIDAFLAVIRGKHELLFRGDQLAVRKCVDRARSTD